MQRRLGVTYRRFETTRQSHLPGSVSHIFQGKAVFTALHWKMGPPGCPETSVTKCQTMPRNIPGERRSHLQRVGNLKPRTKNVIFQILSLFRNST